jgi:hypothetical protein
MNRKVNRIDEQGLYIEDVILNDNEETPADCIETPCPGGFYYPKFNKDSDEWEEGKTAEEIEVIKAAEIVTEIDYKAQALKEINAATTISGIKAAMIKYISAE